MSCFSSHYAGYKAELLDFLAAKTDQIVAQYIPQCESPIEVMFCEAFACLAIFVCPNMLHGDDGRTVIIEPQKKHRNYRLDFLITMKDGETTRSVAVECDGHDYHERTKEQARRDKSRDRILALDGLTTLRFTGSEIHADAVECAEQVLNYLIQEIKGAR